MYLYRSVYFQKKQKKPCQGQYNGGSNGIMMWISPIFWSYNGIHYAGKSSIYYWVVIGGDVQP